METSEPITVAESAENLGETLDDRRKEGLRVLKEYFENKYPKTGNPTASQWFSALHTSEIELNDREKKKEQSLNLLAGDDDGIKEPDYFTLNYIGYKSREKEILWLATLMNSELGEEVTDWPDPEKVVEICQERLAGKRILVLGDDTGSCSEVLADFGAIPIGVEYDPRKVAVAHSGALSEDGRPNNYVIQGDIWDLADSESELRKQIGDSFDVIISAAVFNGGSGAEIPKHLSPKLTKIFDSHKLDSRYPQQAFYVFALETFNLLKSGGFEVHQYTDVWESADCGGDYDIYANKLTQEMSSCNGTILSGKGGYVIGDPLILRKNYSDKRLG